MKHRKTHIQRFIDFIGFYFCTHAIINTNNNVLQIRKDKERYRHRSEGRQATPRPPGRDEYRIRCIPDQPREKIRDFFGKPRKTKPGILWIVTRVHFTKTGSHKNWVLVVPHMKILSLTWDCCYSRSLTHIFSQF